MLNIISFDTLNAFSDDGLFQCVAVPSRLYDLPTPERPLAGKRLSIKDNYRLSEVQTTLSNRDFARLNSAETRSADFVGTLIKLGAIVVGKTKLCAFASSEKATDEWIDFHAPFNPRADGY